MIAQVVVFKHFSICVSDKIDGDDKSETEHFIDAIDEVCMRFAVDGNVYQFSFEVEETDLNADLDAVPCPLYDGGVEVDGQCAVCEQYHMEESNNDIRCE